MSRPCVIWFKTFLRFRKAGKSPWPRLKTRGGAVELTTQEAQDVIKWHTRRTTQGMLGGALTSVDTCSWCRISWPCETRQHAEDLLLGVSTWEWATPNAH